MSPNSWVYGLDITLLFRLLYRRCCNQRDMLRRTIMSVIRRKERIVNYIATLASPQSKPAIGLQYL